MIYMIKVDPVELAEGLCLFWNDNIQVCQSNPTSFYIEIYIHDMVDDHKYQCIFFYLILIKLFVDPNYKNFCIIQIIGA